MIFALHDLPATEHGRRVCCGWPPIPNKQKGGSSVSRKKLPAPSQSPRKHCFAYDPDTNDCKALMRLYCADAGYTCRFFKTGKEAKEDALKARQRLLERFGTK